MLLYNNILCISAADLIEQSFLTKNMYDNYCKRKQINRVRRASYESPALIEVASLPEKILAKLRQRYGENFDRVADSYSLEARYSLSQDALQFYRNWLTSDGCHLSKRLIEEYSINASLLIALRQYYNDRLTYIKSRGGSTAGLWKNVSDIVNALKNKVSHSLPANHRRLKAKLEEFESKGYAALVSGKVANSNSSALTAKAKEWLLSRWTDQVNRCATIEQLYDEYISKAMTMDGWKIISSSKTIYNFIYDEKVAAQWWGYRYGELKSKERFSYQHKTKLPGMRDSLWYSDGTKLNYYYQYLDNSGKRQVGTLQVYEVMDAYSEVLLGYCISDKEDFKAQYAAYKMALQTAGYKPYQIEFDNQGGHKKLENSKFLNKLAHIAIHTQPYNGKSKTIENAFYRLQSEFLKRDWFFSGQNITAKKAESKANMEYILANKDNLPTREELIKRYEQRRQEWNNATTSTGKSRLENYLSSTNPQAVKLDILDMVELFAVTRPREVTCTAAGISFREQNIRYDYMVVDGEGMPDLAWLELNVGKSFVIKFDPEDMEQIFLYDHASDGSLRLSAIAKTKTVIHRGKQEQEEWEASYIKRVELANKAKRIERKEKMEALQAEYGTSNEDYGMNSPALAGIESSRKAKRKRSEKQLVAVSIGAIEKVESNAVAEDEEFDPLAIAARL